ncbi:unnamed protein product [Echinostoma caproni]|uniref:DHHA2 domain-containing protein n=1 Tax=Echinostoma caproni TaxID=27848 RepID=A0A183B9B6_9TREM|nr:unnamed protein product [Echinostoma caproni]
MYSELSQSFDEDTLPMREIPILHEVAETSDWASTQIALEATLVALGLQGSIIHDLRGKVSSLDNDLSHLTALLKDNFPACAAAGQVFALSKQQIFDTAAKLKSTTISAKRIIICGSFPSFNSPVQATKTFFRSLTAPSLPKPLGASWLKSKSKKTKVGILITFNSESVVADALAQTETLKRAFSEVEEQLKRANSFSSMSPDEIHPRILKESADMLAATYAHLF